MTFKFPQSHLARQGLGAVMGMLVATLLYVGLQQLSSLNIRGSLVGTDGASSSVMTQEEMNAKLIAEGEARASEKAALIASRLQAIATRHAESSSAAAEVASSVSSDAPAVDVSGNPYVSPEERLALRASRARDTLDQDQEGTAQEESEVPGTSLTIASAAVPGPETDAGESSDLYGGPSTAVSVDTSLPNSGAGMNLLILISCAVGYWTVKCRQRTRLPVSPRVMGW